MKERSTSHPESVERRRFLETVAKYGFTTAVVAGAAGTLMSSEALAQTAKEESERKKAAKHTMIFATAYVVGISRIYPIMQLDFKENVQNMTNGEIYVNLAPGKKLGAGAKLAKKVQQGIIQVAQHSISNFAPYAPAADIINIPYWCAKNQNFVNLVTSDVWRELVNPKIEASGFKALWYASISSRNFAVRKGGKPIITPDDIKGVKFRVPGSKMLQQFYRLLGANPTPIAWGETPTAIKQGVADALDPTLPGYIMFGFQDIISHITLAQSVHGGQVFSCNLEWFNGLPKSTQDAVLDASDITFRQNLAKVPAAAAYARAEILKAGIQLHDLTDDQINAFAELGGYKRPEWDSFKKDLTGSLANFERMLEAANTDGKYYVRNV